jgi:uncharacterized protein (DUF2062 family)
VTSPITSTAVANPIPVPHRHPIGRFFQAHVISPLLHLLRVGASPRKLAWSLAVGAAIGINPVVGSTTLICLGIAVVFRLNLIASQIANHLLFPLQLALALVYLRAGEVLFHTGPLPLASNVFLHAIRHGQWSTAHLLWTWEWHAIVVWLLGASVLTPLLAAGLHPLLKRLLVTLHHHPHSTGAPTLGAPPSRS